MKRHGGSWSSGEVAVKLRRGCGEAPRRSLGRGVAGAAMQRRQSFCCCYASSPESPLFLCSIAGVVAAAMHRRRSRRCFYAASPGSSLLRCSVAGVAGVCMQRRRGCRCCDAASPESPVLLCIIVRCEMRKTSWVCHELVIERLRAPNRMAWQAAYLSPKSAG